MPRVPSSVASPLIAAAACALALGVAFANAPSAPAAVPTAPQAVSLGQDFSCAVIADGTVKCWGQNSGGLLTLPVCSGPEVYYQATCLTGQFAYKTSPYTLTGVSSASAVASGAGHLCYLVSSGTVKCLGVGGSGQLGNGATSDSSSPVSVSGITTATQVSSGSSHSCALLTGGSIKCWGANGNGQLGNASNTDSSTPVSVSGITTATQVSAGGNKTCARLSDSSIKCWGYGANGQIGDGGTSSRTSPVAVSGISTATQVAVGGKVACALLSDSTLKCWGDNYNGGVGDGTTTSRSTPVAVTGISNATAVAAGAGSVCAILSDATAKCWGQNTNGQLGNNTTSFGATSSPVVVSGLSSATQIAVGAYHACATITGGGVSCWGRNSYGGLGNNSQSDSKVPVVAIAPPDTTPPTTPGSFTGVPSSPTNLNFATIGWTLGEAGGTVECRLDSGSWATCANRTSYSLSGLADGSHTVSVRQTDAAGNVSQVGTSSAWTVDTTAPVAPSSFTGMPSSPTKLTGATIGFTLGESGGTVECRTSIYAAWSACTSVSGTSGTYTVSGLADGSRSVMVRQTDAAGNVGATATSPSWTVDATAPLAPFYASGRPFSPTILTSATIVFTLNESGGTVECRLDSGTWGACTSTGSFSATLALSGLADGSHTVSVRQTDAAGNVSQGGTMTAWVVDTTAPSTPGSFTGVPSSPTNQTGATIGFTLGESGGIVECRVDADSWGSCSTVSGTTGSKVVSGLGEGSHTVSVRQRDAVGNVSQIGTTSSWTVDTIAPTRPGSFTGVPSSPTNLTGATVGFTLGESGGTVECRVDSGSWGSCSSVSGTSGSHTVSGLGDGSHSVSVRQTDAAGNVSQVGTTSSWTVVVDATAPAAPGSFTGVPSSPTSQTGATIGFTLGESGGTIECRVDSGSWGSCSSVSGTTGSHTVSGLDEGSHTVSVRQTDAAGNTSQVGTTSSWTVDATAPAAPLLSGAPPGSTTLTTASISFTGEAGATFTCSLDGGPFSACTSPVALTGLSLGQHSFAVKATDAAGNTSDARSVTWTVVVPVGAPTVLTPAAGTKTVLRRTVAGKSTWVMRLGLLFSTGGDTRSSAQFLTVQVAVDSAGRPVSTRPSDSQPLPTAPTFTQGIVTWDASGEMSRATVDAPVWVRVGNRVGKWSAWVRLTR